jgi:hypothetical protein
LDIWDEDKIRIDKLKNYGYNLEVLWESDFSGHESIIKICQKYVKN